MRRELRKVTPIATFKRGDLALRRRPFAMQVCCITRPELLSSMEVFERVTLWARALTLNMEGRMVGRLGEVEKRMKYWKNLICIISNFYFKRFRNTCVSHSI